MLFERPRLAVSPPEVRPRFFRSFFSTSTTATTTLFDRLARSRSLFRSLSEDENVIADDATERRTHRGPFSFQIFSTSFNSLYLFLFPLPPCGEKKKSPLPPSHLSGRAFLPQEAKPRRSPCPVLLFCLFLAPRGPPGPHGAAPSPAGPARLVGSVTTTTSNNDPSSSSAAPPPAPAPSSSALRDSHVSTPEAGLLSRGGYFLLFRVDVNSSSARQDGSTTTTNLVAVPVEEWHTFRPPLRHAVPTLEEAEAAMEARA